MTHRVHQLLLAVIFGAIFGSHIAQGEALNAPWVPDLGNGTYQNPVLAGDYSDPDVLRVGEDFYLTASSFSNVPGLPILHSRDLVNWTLIGHAISQNVPAAHFATPRHGGGVWAPSIRYHSGKFLVFYPDPDQGIFMVSALNPRGPWSAPALVFAAKGAIDPAPFWDDDGSGWLVMGWAKSRAGVNNIVTLKRLDADATRTEGEDRGLVIIDGALLAPAITSRGPLPWSTIEGPKLYKRAGWYYVFAPAGGVKPGWQGVFRSRHLAGPYEGRDVLDQGGTEINGPHQGAWVTTAAGEDWFLHFQDTDSYGRRVLLEPLVWNKDWPVIGVDKHHIGRGEPVLVHTKPKVTGEVAISVPQTDDEFDHAFSLAWQWQANPQEDWSSLTEAPGALRLNSISASSNLYEAGNLLTQKLPGPVFKATTKLLFAPLAVGEEAGLIMVGYDYAWIGLRKTAQGVTLVQRVAMDAVGGQAEHEAETAAIKNIHDPVFLRLSVEPVTTRVALPEADAWPCMSRETHARVIFSYSLDGLDFKAFGEPLITRPGRWVGAQMGLFAVAPSGTPSYVATSVGHADFDWFRVSP